MLSPIVKPSSTFCSRSPWRPLRLFDFATSFQYNSGRELAGGGVYALCDMWGWRYWWGAGWTIGQGWLCRYLDRYNARARGRHQGPWLTAQGGVHGTHTLPI